jgi:hypothetical protein
MRLYLLTQISNNGYDTYDSCVVCAENEEDAKSIHPDGSVFIERKSWSTWTATKDQISCEEIGVSIEGLGRGVIIASFNAG